MLVGSSEPQPRRESHRMDLYTASDLGYIDPVEEKSSPLISQPIHTESTSIQKQGIGRGRTVPTVPSDDLDLLSYFNTVALEVSF